MFNFEIQPYGKSLARVVGDRTAQGGRPSVEISSGTGHSVNISNFDFWNSEATAYTDEQLCRIAITQFIDVTGPKHVDSVGPLNFTELPWSGKLDRVG